MKNSLFALAAAVSMVAGMAVSDGADTPGFLKWIEEPTVAKGKPTVIDWCTVGDEIGNRASCMYKIIAQGTMFIRQDGAKVHDFMALGEDVTLEITNLAYVASRKGGVQSPMSEDYLHQVAQRFDPALPMDLTTHEGHLIETRQTLTIPAGRVGAVLNPFWNVKHPDCTAGACEIEMGEILDMISKFTVVAASFEDDPYDNVSRIKNGALVYRKPREN